ncbi:EthD family reductase [Fibrivirga algicola]|uniref:EthD family reductase n=1 Tax=Fibrivirga algicola TaxID=2950420 RepID=A0ABX0QBI4_9BACT|nr:EthD family reductase [Fibrivirga algicola]NID09714.1 EthD family reductase [Fibrivirga algicola]
MVSLTVLYPKTADSQFDMAYYLNTHTPLVKARLSTMGLLSVDMREGLAGGAPGTLPPYAMITSLTFNTMDELQKGMDQHGAELLGDIPNFTDVEPQTQICQVR